MRRCVMKKILPVILVAVIVCIVIVRSVYDTQWMIGKNSDEIQARYGQFDYHSEEAAEDGLYKDCVCFYLVQTNETDLFGDPLPDERLYIYFDADGIAYEAYKHVDGGG